MHYFFLVCLLVGGVLSVRSHKLTLAGGIAGSVIAALIYLGVGFAGVVLLGTFFILGVAATGWRRKDKERLQGFAKEEDPRTAGQVLANGGVAAAAATACFLFPEYTALMLIAIAGSLAAATADTLSSEMGMLYGSNFYNITSFRKDKCGENGVVSLEGTLIGVAGSAMIAAIYCAGTSWGADFLIVVVAGTIGNLTDSVLGATLERRGLVGNNAVNALNTLAGALCAAGLHLLIG
jgi:uncharacterized protein (TIGR00297 family)